MQYELYGIPLTASDQRSVDQIAGAVGAYLAARADVAEGLQRATEADPLLLMAPCMSAYLAKLAGDRANSEKAARVFVDLQARMGSGAGTAWERGHVEALGCWVAGNLDAVTVRLEALLKEFPADALALRMLHYLYFYQGDPRPMRDSIARRMHHYPADHPLLPFVKGMLAFGLEEAGNLSAAERFGREAVAANPGDLWAAHAVAHVLETQGRWQEGIDWIVSLKPHWAGANNFRHHLDWHLALFHLASGEPEGALALYDEVLEPSVAEDFYLNMCNASSLLMRLRVAGLEVGDRWQVLAEVARRHATETELVFASLHYLVPLLMVRDPAAEQLLATLERWSDSATSQGRVAAEVGREAALFLVAVSRDDGKAALALFEALRYRLHGIGGSHAQRALFPILARDLAWRVGYRDWVRDFDAEHALARA